LDPSNGPLHPKESGTGRGAGGRDELVAISVAELRELLELVGGDDGEVAAMRRADDEVAGAGALLGRTTSEAELVLEDDDALAGGSVEILAAEEDPVRTHGRASGRRGGRSGAEGGEVSGTE
jgi:hypothetical protein